jgi:hypothetical protein
MAPASGPGVLLRVSVLSPAGGGRAAPGPGSRLPVDQAQAPGRVHSRRGPTRSHGQCDMAPFNLKVVTVTVDWATRREGGACQPVPVPLAGRAGPGPGVAGGHVAAPRTAASVGACRLLWPGEPASGLPLAVVACRWPRRGRR